MASVDGHKEVSMIATDEEIRDYEREDLALLPADRREYWAEHAARVNADVVKALANLRPRKKPICASGPALLRAQQVPPSNGPALVAACRAEACRRFSIEGSELDDSENHGARWWTIAALTSVPATAPVYRKGVIGPRMAKVLLGLPTTSLACERGQLAERYPIQARAAQEFGSKLTAEWTTDERTP
jgi:hypothetical protein